MGWKRFDDINKGLQDQLEPSFIKGGNDTLAAAVIFAKGNHPGWNNVTGAAEGSIQFEPMKRVSEGRYRGALASKSVDYFIWLEIGTRFHAADFTLRRAADVEFPQVWDRIRAYL